MRGGSLAGMEVAWMIGSPWRDLATVVLIGLVALAVRRMGGLVVWLVVWLESRGRDALRRVIHPRAAHRRRLGNRGLEQGLTADAR